MTLKQASCTQSTLSTPCPRLRVVAVVLAAGTATRMGGRPKSLLLREGQTLLARLLQQLAQAGIDQTVLVLGHHAQLIQQALQNSSPDLSGPKNRTPMQLLTVMNPAPEAGQNSSLNLGLAAAQALSPEWLMVALADQPLLEAADFKDLIAAVKQAPSGTQMLQPSVNGQPGNPVLLSRHVMQSILENPLWGGKEWRQHHPEQVLAWPSTNTHYRIDMDTPEDIAKLSEEYGIELTWGQTH
jgi:molybdenum cofactor cytidylyltransferase